MFDAIVVYHYSECFVLLFLAKVVAASSQLRKVKTVMEATRQEMAEYKEKASRILQVM